MEPKNKPNRLIHEKSPYLLQHAYNPVDWYPWGPEAFKKAGRENRPIFLSIGYSTCHWCHVMERESFTDSKISEIMNRHYVSIKMDREERPDVDKLYMTAVLAMTGSGGWPLSVWLTPEGKPFFGGTYFPPENRWGRPGFAEILERIARAWRENPDQILSSGEQLLKALQEAASPEGSVSGLEPAWLENAFQTLRASYDPNQGGFGHAPKFPMPVYFNFLLRVYERTQNREALEMVSHTLRQMAGGGIYDHLGGGFHRYSTDAHWLLPHFEKMLYDNAQLAIAYLEAYQITGERDFKRIAQETLDYILRDLSSPEGGIYSAEDADSQPYSPVEGLQSSRSEGSQPYSPVEGLQSSRSEGSQPALEAKEKEEGAFYTWTQAEIIRILGSQASGIFNDLYGIQEDGNVSTDAQGEFRGKNILHMAHSLSETSKKFKRTEKEVEKIIADSLKTLFSARNRRTRPHRDDKVVASWNGLCLSAFSRGWQLTREPRYLKAAEKLAEFLQTHLYDPKACRLYRSWREGERKALAILDDYAFITQGLLDLYESSFDPAHLDWALQLTREQNRLFWDEPNGGFYMTAADQDPHLLVRIKEDSDNVEPNGNSVAALNLLRLSQFANRKDFRETAEKTLRHFGPQMRQNPRALPQMLAALHYALSKPRQILIAGNPQDPQTQNFLREVYSRFLPNKILMVLEGGAHQKKLSQRFDFLKTITPIKERPTAYLCQNYRCELPTNDLTVFRKLLDQASKW